MHPPPRTCRMSRMHRARPDSTRAPLAVALLAVVISVATPARALPVGAAAPEIDLADLEGRRVTLASLRGQVVVIDFWASWCACCAQQLPFLERLRAEHPAGLVVIGIAEEVSDASVRGLLARTGAHFTIVRDARHAVAGRYAPRAMPTTFIVDRAGVVRFEHEGFRSEDASRIQAEVEQLLAEPPP